LTNRWSKAWQGGERALPWGALILHEGWIILRIESRAGSGNIRDVSRTGTLPERLGINGRRARGHDAGSAGLSDGSKNAIQRSLKANHLTLHDLVENYNCRRMKRRSTYDILAFKARQTSKKESVSVRKGQVARR